MTDKLPVRRGVRYSDAEVDRALIALSFARNVKEAVEILKREGKIMPTAQTLTKWRDETHTDRYLELCQKNADQREKIITEELMPVIRTSIQATAELMDLQRTMAEKGEVRDPAAAARNAATVAAIFIDKKMALEGRPTSTIEHRNPAEILRLLRERGRVTTSADVESTVEEES